MGLTHDEKERDRLRAAALYQRELMREARSGEDYPATMGEVDELVLVTLREADIHKQTPGYDAAYEYLWDLCAPASVREMRDIVAPENPDFTPTAAPAGYEALASVLNDALEQSSAGKGRERHANDKPFERQPIMEITREQGLGFPMGQARKKVSEAAGMLRRQEPASARHELLGAIVYLAAAVLAIEEGMR